MACAGREHPHRPKIAADALFAWPAPAANTAREAPKGSPKTKFCKIAPPGGSGGPQRAPDKIMPPEGSGGLERAPQDKIPQTYVLCAGRVGKGFPKVPTKTKLRKMKLLGGSGGRPKGPPKPKFCKLRPMGGPEGPQDKIPEVSGVTKSEVSGVAKSDVSGVTKSEVPGPKFQG